MPSDAIQQALAAARDLFRMPVGDPMRYAYGRRLAYFEKQLTDDEFAEYQGIRNASALAKLTEQGGGR